MLKGKKIGIIPGILIVLFLVVFAGQFNRASDEEAHTDLKLADAHAIAVAIDDPQKLYIANHGGIYALTGDKLLTDVSQNRTDFMSFALHPSDPNIMFASGHPSSGGNLGLQKSVDGGDSWTEISSGLDGPVDFHTLAVDQVNPDLVYGYFSGRLQRSTDGGANWQYVDIPTKIIQLATGPDQDVVYATTASGIIFSEDRGDTWDQLNTFNGVAISLAINPENSDEMTIYSDVDELLMSSDRGQTWSPVSAPLDAERVFYMSYAKSDPATIYILTEKLRVFVSNDSGVSWQQYN